MSLAHRPTLVLEVPAPLSTVRALLRSGLREPWLEARWSRPPALADQGLPTNHLILTHRPEHRRFWSPWLTLELQAAGDEQTRVGGRFSPHPSVWIGFLFAYLGLGAASLFATIFGFAQWSLGAAPVALWVLAGTTAVTAALWWSAQLGQRLGRRQMGELRLALHAALRLPPPAAE